MEKNILNFYAYDKDNTLYDVNSYPISEVSEIKNEKYVKNEENNENNNNEGNG